ncbi:MAG: dTDP-4-dehydrorhamnose 3,5-epimerase [Planctomycetes bacterium]|nr:dTDP-4-dehydrorhamnose 3,5-epimerase [Planctomycetota bacterium]
MKAISLEIPGLVLIELEIRRDGRGFFVERYHAGKFEEFGVPARFVQENHSRSRPGVLRGLHIQHTPPQGKLVGVIKGRIWDVVVDLRGDSPTFGQHSAIELSETNGRLLWIPAGFAHGFLVLGDEPADVVYSVDAFYNPEGEGGIAWNDPDLAIPWPIKNPIISKRDKWLSRFAAFRPVQIPVQT